MKGFESQTSTLELITREALNWVVTQEEIILREGDNLIAEEIELAKMVGVSNPDKVK